MYLGQDENNLEPPVDARITEWTQKVLMHPSLETITFVWISDLKIKMFHSRLQLL
jgi:hypothetical protein